MRAEREGKIKRETEYLGITEWTGLNLYDPHALLNSGEMRGAINIDIFPKFLKSRRGSENINGLTRKLADEAVLSSIQWDVGTSEYVIVQTLNGATSKFWYWKIDSAQDPQQLYIKGGTTQFTIASQTANVDWFISGNRLFGFCSQQNFQFEWDGTSAFVKTQMGLPLPILTSVSGTGSGNLTGIYTYGIELVYRQGVDTFDSAASSPNRKNSVGKVLKTTFTGQQGSIVVDSTVLTSDTLWTHIRLYRSKRLDANTSGSQFLDVVGLETELYPCQLIAKAAFISAAYTFTDNLTDDELPNATAGAWYPLYTIDKIELSPISDKPARIGTYHKERVWFGGVSNDATQSRIYYSNYAGTPYAGQYDIYQYRDVDSGDGQQTIKLISFEKDLVALKEAKTCVLTDGNPEIEFDVRDHKIGVTHIRAAQYIPGIGICAITNDQGDFKIFGYNQSWTNVSSVEVSRTIRTVTQTATLSVVSIFYLNGKLWLSLGTGTFYVLHVENERGWSRYDYPMNSRAEVALTYNNGSKGLVISRNTYMVQIDDATVSTDRNTADDTTDDIYGDIYTHQFSVNNGRGILDFERLSITADLTDALVGTPYVNGLPWPGGVSATQINFILDPNTYTSTALRQMEYNLYIEPPRPLANYLHFRLYTKAPFTIQTVTLVAIIDTANFPNFDPFQYTVFHTSVPNWGNQVILHLPFDESAGDIAYDISGRSRHHSWVAGSPAGSHAYDSALAPGGGQSIIGGTSSYYGDSDWSGLDLLQADGYLSDAMTYESEVYVTTLASAIIIDESGDGSNLLRFKINTDGSLEFDVYTHNSSSAVVINKKFYTTAGIITVSTTPYTIQFCLSNGGLNGQFFAGLKTGSTSQIITQSGVLA